MEVKAENGNGVKWLSGGYCGSGGDGFNGVKQEENGGKISLLFHYLCKLCKM